MNKRGILATYLIFSLSKITNPENTSHFNIVNDPNSNRVNDLLIHNRIPVTIYNNLLTYRDTNIELEIQGDLLKLMTNKTYNMC